MDTPVAIVVFNRPLYTEKVFQQIAKVRPRRLFVIADGPRPDHPSDVKLCSDARAITERVDWKCEVSRNYSEVNLGAGLRPYTGFDWVFGQIDRCIILEDDTVPDQSFFYFCQDLLRRYLDDERVMHISGRGVFPDNPSRKYSYYFSATLSGTGWATWARAWKHYDFKIRFWPEFRDTHWPTDMMNSLTIEESKNSFDYIYKQAPKVTVWDTQWLLACWSQNGLGIRPYRNLIKNIGFTEEATHKSLCTFLKRIDIPLSSVAFPLRHPPFVTRNREADEFHRLRYVKAQHATLRATWMNRQKRRISKKLAKLSCRYLPKSNSRVSS